MFNKTMEKMQPSLYLNFLLSHSIRCFCSSNRKTQK